MDVDIKKQIAEKVVTALSAINRFSSTQSDRDASETVLNLMTAYDLIDRIQEREDRRRMTTVIEGGAENG